MEYKASLDKWSIIMTTFSLVILVVVIVIMRIAFIKSGEAANYKYLLSGVIAFTFLIYLFIYLFSIKKYIVANNNLTIVRTLGNVEIPLSSIKEASVVDNDSLRWSIRTFGNGGLFGFYGKFYNRNYGNMTWYATQRRNYIMITTTGNKKIVITPDDTSMVNELKN